MTLRITYFPFPGRAEPVRVACFLGGVELEDVRVPGAEFMRLKQSGALPLGALPTLDLGDGGPTIAQCVPMLRYVAAIGDAPGLIPSDPVKALVVDSALDTFNDTLSHAFGPSLRESDPEKKRVMREAFAAGPLPTCLAYVEGLAEAYGDDGPFLTGAELSIADLYIAPSLLHYSSGNVDFVDPGIIDNYPRLAALRDAYVAHPQIQAYRSRG